MTMQYSLVKYIVFLKHKQLYLILYFFWWKFCCSLFFFCTGSMTFFWKKLLVYVIVYLLTMTDQTGIYQHLFHLTYMLKIFYCSFSQLFVADHSSFCFTNGMQWFVTIFKTFHRRHYIKIFFFCNQFCSFLFFTKIINNICFSKWIFFLFKSKDFIQEDYKSIKNLKKNRKCCNISQDRMKWVEETLPENKEK